MDNKTLELSCQYGLSIPLHSKASSIGEEGLEVYLKVLKQDAARVLPKGTIYEIKESDTGVYWYYDTGYKGDNGKVKPEDKLVGRFQA